MESSVRALGQVVPTFSRTIRMAVSWSSGVGTCPLTVTTAVAGRQNGTCTTATSGRRQLRSFQKGIGDARLKRYTLLLALALDVVEFHADADDDQERDDDAERGDATESRGRTGRRRHLRGEAAREC
jgi:hypothetical protein